MIDFYAVASPNVLKVFIALEELALTYQIRPVDVFGDGGEQFKPEFIRLNPNGKVPVIIDHDGPSGRPLTIFESGAILLYLAEKTGRLLPEEKAARFAVIEWLMVQVSGQGPM